MTAAIVLVGAVVLGANNALILIALSRSADRLHGRINELRDATESDAKSLRAELRERAPTVEIPVEKIVKRKRRR